MVDYCKTDRLSLLQLGYKKTVASTLGCPSFPLSEKQAAMEDFQVLSFYVFPLSTPFFFFSHTHPFLELRWDIC